MKLHFFLLSTFTALTALAGEPDVGRVVLHVKTPQKTYGRPEGPEKRIVDREGKPAAQNQQFDQRTREFRMPAEDVFWGEVQIQGVAATGERGIVKSTHDLIGIKSFSYRPEHHGPDPHIKPKGTGGYKDDNFINHYGNAYKLPSEILRLQFPVPVRDIGLIVVQLADAEELVWRGCDTTGRVVDQGSFAGSDGKPIPHIDDQNEFGKNATCKLLLVSTSTFSILELEAGPDSAYALAAIEYTREPGSNRSPDSRSHAAENE